ncbi:MAG: YiiX/YebB-like N1pC/P60 family cysteine hydrolase [Litoreibacter sp.]
MKKKLNEVELKPADIILTTTDEPVSKLIRWGTWSDISHAMLYVQHCSAIDATSDGVHSQNTQRLFFELNWPVHVLRLREELDSETAKRICDYVRERVGAEYSTQNALMAGARLSNKASHKQFCSRLVAKAFEEFGRPLVASPDTCTPAILLKSNALFEVSNALRKISDEEVKAWQNHTDTTQMMRDKTNTVLDAIRRLDPSIQRIDNAVGLAVLRPDIDDKIANIFVESGYLDVWKLEREKSPWQYDLAKMSLMSVKHPTEVIDYCQNVIRHEDQSNHRHEQNLQAFLSVPIERRTKTHNLFVDLYQNICKLHQTRINVARSWLRKNT